MSARAWAGVATGVLVACFFGVGLYVLKEIEDANLLRARYLSIFRNQPDLLATLDAREGPKQYYGYYSRLGAKRMIALPVPTTRREPGSDGPTTQALVIFDKGAIVTVVFQEFKSFRKNYRSSLPATEALEDPFLAVAGFLKDKNPTVVEIGATRVGNYDVQLIEISDGKSDPIRAFICPSLRDAIVRLEIPIEYSKNNTASQYELSDVKLEFDEAIFKVPKGYRDLSPFYLNQNMREMLLQARP